MNDLLSICILIQCAFFFIFLLFQKNDRNNGITAFFGLNFLIYGICYWINTGKVPANYSELVNRVFLFIAYLNPVFIFYLIYSLIQKPINNVIKLFWLLPFLGVGYRIILMYIYPDVYTFPYYQRWVFDFSLYYKIFFLIVLLIEIKNINKHAQSISFNNNNLNFLAFMWGRWFLIFQVVRIIIGYVYLFITLANGRLFYNKLNYFVYSEENYNTIQDVFLAYFLFVFGYLAIKNARVFKDSEKESYF